jgi:hypothetical protein
MKLPALFKSASLGILISMISIQVSHAEIYRWVDENGKTHFSDKPPHKIKSEDISETLQQQNIDYSAGSTSNQVQQHIRHQSAKQTEQQQIEQQRPKDNDAANCLRARQALHAIKGRVIFFDKDGQEIKTTEKNRAEKAAKLSAEINRRCK